jgi:large subunit ribosomal protein L23
MALFAKKTEPASTRPPRLGEAGEDAKSTQGGEEKGETRQEGVAPIKSEKKAAKNKKIQNKTEKKDADEMILGIVKDDVIIEPWITEKGHGAMAENKYIFRVRKESNKKKIKLSIESLYRVKVVDVNIINIPAKKRMYGRHEGKKSGYKKAIVKLKEGDKIELFKGV